MILQHHHLCKLHGNFVNLSKFSSSSFDDDNNNDDGDDDTLLLLFFSRYGVKATRETENNRKNFLFLIFFSLYLAWMYFCPFDVHKFMVFDVFISIKSLDRIIMVEWLLWTPYATKNLNSKLKSKNYQRLLANCTNFISISLRFQSKSLLSLGDFVKQMRCTHRYL